MRTRKVLALLLALAMALSLLPLSAMAVIIYDDTPCPNSPWGSHDYWLQATVERNCQHGEIQYWQCQYCGKWQTYDDYDTGGHDYQSVRVEPTCTQDGYTCLVCSVCGDVARPSTLPATGHTALSVAAKNPTCTDSGYTAGAVCSVCGTVLQGCSYLAPLGHDYQLTYSVAATCTTAGYTVYTCSRCGATYTDSTAALGHNWGSWKVEYPGTCVYPGMNVRKCSRCGTEEYVYSEYGDHDWGEWTLVYAATATTDGLAQRVCKNDASHVEYYVIPATGEPIKHVLKGLTRHYYGVYRVETDGVTYFLEADTTASNAIWQDAVPEYAPMDSAVFTDPEETKRLVTDPVPGETYYFHAGLEDHISYDDHSFDFSQIDPDLVNVTMDGFTVTYRYGEVKQYEASYDEGWVHFAATYNGPETVTVGVIKIDADQHEPLPGAVFQITDDEGNFIGEWTSTGDVYWVDGLVPGGHYTLQEVLAPDGYDLIPPLGFTVTPDGVIVTDTGVILGGDAAAAPVLTVEDHKTDTGEDDILYVLKGVEKHFPGVRYEQGYWPDRSDTPWITIWQDAEPKWEAGESRFFADPGETTDVLVEPVPGETYYFYIYVYNHIAMDDHSIDFTQIDPSLVNVTVDGFTVTFLNDKTKIEALDDHWDHVYLYFSATYNGDGTTGNPTENELNPAISISLWADPGVGNGKRVEGALVPFHYEVTNTGDCPVYVTWWADNDNEYDASAPNGRIEVAGMGDGYGVTLLNPAESYSEIIDHEVDFSDVGNGYFATQYHDPAWYYDTEGSIAKVYGDSNELKVDLTYPDEMTGDTVSLTVKKVWADDDNAQGARPESLAVTLLANGTAMGTVVLNEDNGWSVTADNLPLNDDDGNPIEYTWSEETVEWYALTDTDVDGGMTTLTNTYQIGTAIPGPDEAALVLTWNWDTDVNSVPYPTSQDTFDADDSVYANNTVENTGSVPVLLVLYASDLAGNSYEMGEGLLDPTETYDTEIGYYTISAGITSGTETAELMGTVTITLYYVGYDPATYVNSDNPGTELCKSNEITRTWKVRKEKAEEELKPEVTLNLWADPGAGDGKRYEGAIVTYHYELTNTGNCPVYVTWWPDVYSEEHDASAPNGRTEVAGMGYYGSGVALLYPGETYTELYDHTVHHWEVDDGYFTASFIHEPAWYYDVNGDISLVYTSNSLTVPLTYPDPGDAPKAALTIAWDYDDIYDYAIDNYYSTISPGVLQAEDGAWANYTVFNSGDVALTVYTYAQFGDGYTPSESPYLLENNMIPGNYEPDWWGTYNLGNHITPYTETSELLGTVTVTYWAEGFDPVTGEKLCETEHLSRTWQVAKPGPTIWPIPEESKMEVSIEEFSSRNDPLGYQLTEYWDTMITVKNTGKVDVDEYTLHVDFISDNEFQHSSYVTDGATWYEKTFFHTIPALTADNLWNYSPDGTITEQDVARGYVKITAYVRWVDPDSLETRESNHATVYLPVISKTGLLLKKGLGKAPDNHKYFQEGEHIQWTLTVTNTSDEPITDVVVMDEGVVVGSFAVINPGETLPCSVPDHVVTAYEADVALTVTNIATATGKDLQGTEHTWPSNPVSVPTNEASPDPVPPIITPDDPGKDPGGDPGNTPIDPPETPDKDKKQTDETPHIPSTGDGDHCKLEIKSLGNSEIVYALHLCEDHAAVALAEEESRVFGSAKDWSQAIQLWRDAIDELYADLYAVADPVGQAAVKNDQEVFWAYIEAFEAMNADKDQGKVHQEICDLLRLWCAELCCMKSTAPEQLPSSMLNHYGSRLTAGKSEASSREFGDLNGSDCDVTIRLSADLADTMKQTANLLRRTSKDVAAEVFVQAQKLWQMKLDSTVNAAYKAADREARKTIAAWRKLLDQLVEARSELLCALYPDNPEIVQEGILVLYRDAAIDSTIEK